MYEDDVHLYHRIDLYRTSYASRNTSVPIMRRRHFISGDALRILQSDAGNSHMSFLFSDDVCWRKVLLALRSEGKPERTCGR